jgi:hypothetical protein
VSNINRLDPLELLRVENQELRTLLHNNQSRIREMQQVAAQHVVLTQIVAALATAGEGGAMVVTYEQIQAASDHNAFRFMVERSPRDDGKIDARVVVYPLSDEERAAMRKLEADASEVERLADSKGKLILPE